MSSSDTSPRMPAKKRKAEDDPVATEVKGHLLCLLPFPEPKGLTDRLKSKYPKLKISYHESILTMTWKAKKGVVAATWKDVTHLCTLIEFPADPSMVPKLELVHMLCAGLDHIWEEPIYRDTTIPMTTSTGVHGPTIGEWVMMVMLVASRRYDELHRRQLAQAWDETGGGKSAFNTVEDNVGKRFGILGYGSLGRQVARLATVMGMTVYVHTASPRPTPESRRDNGYYVPGTGDPEGVLPTEWYSGTDKKSIRHFLNQKFDYILISVPLTSKTARMIGKEEFAILSKTNAYVINVSRGEVIVQDELIKALHAYEDDKVADESDRPRKGLRGAALDVAYPEPLPKGHPLWKAPNIIITPHLSGVNNRYAQRCFEVLELNLERAAQGKRYLNLVDREKGYSSSV